MNETERINQAFLDIEKLKLQIARLVSDTESEKDTRRRTTESLMKVIQKIENDFKDILYGTDRISGMVVELDRLKQESIERKRMKNHIYALWIAVGAGIIKEMFDVFTVKK